MPGDVWLREPRVAAAQRTELDTRIPQRCVPPLRASVQLPAAARSWTSSVRASPRESLGTVVQFQWQGAKQFKPPTEERRRGQRAMLRRRRSAGTRKSETDLRHQIGEAIVRRAAAEILELEVEAGR